MARLGTRVVRGERAYPPASFDSSGVGKGHDVNWLVVL
jgi:hypothetical protein